MYKDLFKSLELDAPSVEKIVGANNLGYKQSLAHMSDAQLDDSVYKYTIGSRTYFLLSQKPLGELTLTRSNLGSPQTLLVKPVKTSLASVARETLGPELWTEADMQTTFSKGAALNVKTAQHPTARNKMPDSISKNGSLKSYYEYLLKYGVINSDATPAGDYTLFFDPSSGQKKNAIVITKTITVEGSEETFAFKDATGARRPYLVSIDTPSLIRTYVALCTELGVVMSSIPALVTTMARESGGAINQHRLEIGMVFGSDKYSGFNATRATSFGMFQVLPWVNLVEHPMFKKMLAAIGETQLPKLDSHHWSTLGGSVCLSLAYHLLYVEASKNSAHTLFGTYAGAGTQTSALDSKGTVEQLLSKTPLPSSADFNVYNEVLTRSIMYRAVAHKMSNS